MLPVECPHKKGVLGVTFISLNPVTPDLKSLRAWNRAREKTGISLKPKDLRDFFSQEMGKALIPDRYIDIFQGRAPKNVLAKHYTPQGIKMLREIYDKAHLKVLA